MSSFVELITKILSLLTLFGDAAIVFLLLIIFAAKAYNNSEFLKNLVRFFSRRAVLFSFLVALGGTLGSLFYSEIVGFLPCLLCWWQRIFLYPQVVFLAIALWKKERIFENISLVFSSIGGLIAVYHSYLQFGGSPFIPCSAGGASCAQRFFLEFGYITIPTMSLTAFGIIIVLLLIKKEE